METMTAPSKVYPTQAIHLARIQPNGRTVVYLFLRAKDSHTFVWYRQEKGIETETHVSASTIDEALQQARRHWKQEAFRMVNCGFRYTLPERDEHGANALFHQMVASYNSPNGVYFDEDLGHNCYVQFASNEARNVAKK